MLIRPGDIILTGSDSELVFAVGRDAFMLRDNSHLELTPAVGSVTRRTRISRNISMFTAAAGLRVRCLTSIGRSGRRATDS